MCLRSGDFASIVKVTHIPKRKFRKRKIGVGGRLRRVGTHRYLWLIHAVVQQKLTQRCLTIVLQFKKKFFLRKHKIEREKNHGVSLQNVSMF